MSDTLHLSGKMYMCSMISFHLEGQRKFAPGPCGMFPIINKSRGLHTGIAPIISVIYSCYNPYYIV